MATYSERMHILDMLETGKITPQQATILLDALVDEAPGDLPQLELPEQLELTPAHSELESGTWQNEADRQSGAEWQSPPEEGAAADEPLPDPPEIPPEMRKWRQYWLGLFIFSLGLLVFFAFLMYRALENGGYGFWFFCSWIPFLLSVAAVALSWQSRTMPWLHLRVDQAQDEWPRRIAFSFPLPVGLASWAMRTFGHRIPNLENSGLSVDDMDKLIYGLQDYTSPDNPLYIEVDEDDGERVLIYIG
jgi:hypothetical protein